jgi:hypothetical protein
VQIRYHIDPATGLPHIYQHDVSEQEVEDILAGPLQDIRGRDGSRIALGQTEAGRYLKVIYVPDPVPDSVFVITAYELGPKAKRALRRRKKKKR